MLSSRLSKRLPSALKSSSSSSSSSSSCSILEKSFRDNLTLSSSTTAATTTNYDRSSFSTSTMSNSSNSNSMNDNNGSVDGREVVTFLGLNNLSDNAGAIKRGRRVGRGIGSSKGKTCGKGHKGQKSRAGGGPHPFFEGGQTPFYKRIPKRGFTNNLAQPMVPVNVGTIQDYIDMGRLVIPNGGENDNDYILTMKDLVEAGITKNSSIKHGVKLLAKGKERLKTPFKIEISRASAGAVEAIEKVGGEVTTVHYNKLALRALLKPEKFDIIPKRARPPPKLMQYYTDYEKRGYLSPEIQLKKLKKILGDADTDADTENKKN